MNIWLEIFRLLPILIFGLLLIVALALFAYDGLRFCVHNFRSWRLNRQGAPETDAVHAVERHQGAFHLASPGAIRQRFAHRYEVELKTHWYSSGKWKAER